jgi:uncharacterized protein (TIGR02391 family)
MKSEAEFNAFQTAALLPRKILHPKLADTVWNAFVRGEYDVAAFQAMKSVEVGVRETAGLAKADIGVALMRKAFDVDNGPLTDLMAERAHGATFLPALSALTKTRTPTAM